MVVREAVVDDGRIDAVARALVFCAKMWRRVHCTRPGMKERRREERILKTAWGGRGWWLSRD